MVEHLFPRSLDFGLAGIVVPDGLWLFGISSPLRVPPQPMT